LLDIISDAKASKYRRRDKERDQRIQRKSLIPVNLQMAQKQKYKKREKQ
jgi:hypothetical protein